MGGKASYFAVIMALHVSASTALSVEPLGRVTFAGLGVSFEAPAGWFSVPLDFDANLKKTGLTNDERRRILAGPRGTLIASFQKYDPSKTAGLIPTVNVIVLPLDLKNPKHLLPALRQLTDAGGKTLADFSYLVEPRWVKTAGVDAVEFVVTFNMPMPDGTKTRVRARTLAIPSSGRLLQVSFTEPDVEKNEVIYRAFEQAIEVGG